MTVKGVLQGFSRTDGNDALSLAVAPSFIFHIPVRLSQAKAAGFLPTTQDNRKAVLSCLQAITDAQQNNNMMLTRYSARIGRT